jgi:hypothetical protein
MWRYQLSGNLSPRQTTVAEPKSEIYLTVCFALSTIRATKKRKPSQETFTSSHKKIDLPLQQAYFRKGRQNSGRGGHESFS